MAKVPTPALTWESDLEEAKRKLNAFYKETLRSGDHYTADAVRLLDETIILLTSMKANLMVREYHTTSVLDAIREGQAGK